jgi:hypothetical protein
MAYGFDPQAGVPRVQKTGGWRALLGMVVAAAGLGFAGYVYLVPYQKMNRALAARTLELNEERNASQQLAAERERAKAELARREVAEKDKAQADKRRKQAIEDLTSELKTVFGEAGAQVAAGEDRVAIAFPELALFETAKSTALTPQGQATLKSLAGTLKKGQYRTRVIARLAPAAPPKDLSQFKNVGEFGMLRSARALLFLVDAGVGAGSIGVAGALPPARKKPGMPDRLEIEIEPE